MKHRLPVSLLAAALAAGNARGASFDCAKAATPVEKTICATPRLGTLDEQVAAAYTALLPTLTEPQQGHLRDYQRVWLRTRSTEGLAAALTDRLKDLREARRTINGVPLLFLGGSSGRPPFVATDGLAGATAYNAWAESRWQAADEDDRAAVRAEATRRRCHASGKPPDDECLIDMTSHRFTLEFVSPQVISVQEDTSEDVDAAHPMNETKHHLLWLSRSGELKPAELFTGDGHKAVIARHVATFMREVAGRDGKDFPEQTEVACDPANWGLHRNGLHVTAQGEDLRVGRGFVEFDVPWAQFGQSLRPAIAQALRP